MSATKAQFSAKLSENSGLTAAQAEAATDALTETFGEWLKAHGADGPGAFSGDLGDGLKFAMGRSMEPAPHWEVKVSFTAGGLSDFGDGADRFGLPVENG